MPRSDVQYAIEMIELSIMMAIAYFTAMVGFIFIGLVSFYLGVFEDKVETVKPVPAKRPTETLCYKPKHLNVGLTEWKRVNGRLKRRMYIVDMDPSIGGIDDYETSDLKKVKKFLWPLFDEVHDVFKQKKWYRVGGRLTRKSDINVN